MNINKWLVNAAAVGALAFGAQAAQRHDDLRWLRIHLDGAAGTYIGAYNPTTHRRGDVQPHGHPERRRRQHCVR